MKKNQPKKTAAVKQSWQKGGAHRIAYEQRMQDKKTMDQRTSQPAAEVIGHPNADIGVMSLMYRAAALLLLSDGKIQRDHARRLLEAADVILGIDP